MRSFEKSPQVFSLHNLLAQTSTNQAEIKGMVVPVRPVGDSSIKARFKCAWLVFTGKADAVTWPLDQ